MPAGELTTGLSETKKQSLWFFFISIGLFILIPLFWIPMWIVGGAGYQALNTIGQVTGIENAIPVIGLPIGFYVGALLVWCSDYYSKWLGGWLLANSTLFTAYSIWSVVGRPIQIDLPFQLIILFVFIGLILGMQVAGFHLERLINGVSPIYSKARKRRYNRAVQIVVIFLTISALAGVIDTYVRIGGSSADLPAFGILLHGGGLICLFVPLTLLLKTTATNRAIILGPGRGGKTSMIGGAAMSDETHDGNPYLKSLVSEMESGFFPDRTDSNEIFEFSYIKDHGFFKREQTVTTVDYPGEVLTGSPGENITLYDEMNDINPHGGDDDGIFSYGRDRVERLFKYCRDKLKGTYNDPWERIIKDIEESGPEPRIPEMREYIARLTFAADTIVFVIPADDFLLQMIKSDIQDNGLTVPDYHRDLIWFLKAKDDTYELRKLENKNDDQSEYTLTLDLTSGGRRQLVPNTDEDDFDKIDVADRLDDWRGHGDPSAATVHYYDRTDRDRRHPREYLSVYKDLVGEPPEGFQFDLYDFVWVVTMSDLFIPKKNIDDTSLNANNREDIDNDPSDYMAVSRYIQEVHLPGEDANPTTFESYDIETCMSETGEEYVYPLWFETYEEGGETKFDTNVENPLVGTQMLLGRLAGERIAQNSNEADVAVDDFLEDMRESIGGTASKNSIEENETD